MTITADDDRLINFDVINIPDLAQLLYEVGLTEEELDDLREGCDVDPAIAPIERNVASLLYLLLEGAHLGVEEAVEWMRAPHVLIQSADGDWMAPLEALVKHPDPLIVRTMAVVQFELLSVDGPE